MNAPQQQSNFCTGKGYKAGCTITSYYTFNGQRIAMRVQSDANATGVVTWLHGDMLGSASVATDAGGNKIAGSDARYMPYGEPRSGWAGSGLPTDRRFTGQISMAGGLIDMNARTYDPLLGRFISADTIVPNPADPQSLNRFSYSLGNPVKYADPTGHCASNASLGDDYCRPQSINTGDARHLVMSHEGIIIDKDHVNPAQAKAVLDQVRKCVGVKHCDPVTVRGGEGKPLASCSFKYCDYSIRYIVAAGITADQVEGIAFGIYLDYQNRFEGDFQATTFWPISQPTSYSFEDMPSDYLGFVMAARGFTFDEVVGFLGGVQASVSEWQDVALSAAFKNESHLPMSTVAFPLLGRNPIQNVPWPSALSITPIDSNPSTWSVDPASIPHVYWLCGTNCN